MHCPLWVPPVVHCTWTPSRLLPRPLPGLSVTPARTSHLPARPRSFAASQLSNFAPLPCFCRHLPACLPRLRSIDRAFYKFLNDVCLIAFSSSWVFNLLHNEPTSFFLKKLLGFLEPDLLCFTLFSSLWVHSRGANQDFEICCAVCIE
jgi:hypothetical protein